MKINLFRAKLVERGFTQKTFSAAIGINRATLYRWYADSGCITLFMLKRIKEVLGLTDAELFAIFFSM